MERLIILNEPLDLEEVSGPRSERAMGAILQVSQSCDGLGSMACMLLASHGGGSHKEQGEDSDEQTKKFIV